MTEYIERHEAIRALGDDPDLLETPGVWETSDAYTAGAKDMWESDVASIRLAPAVEAVPWGWLERYADGKRINYAADFVAEARKEWEEQDG